MSTSEEHRLESIEHTLNKAYSDLALKVSVTEGYADDAVKRLVSQKITLDEHAQILRNHTARLERIETMLTQLLTHLKETPSSTQPEPSNPVPPEPVRQRRERTFWERALGIFPDETVSEKP